MPRMGQNVNNPERSSGKQNLTTSTPKWVELLRSSDTKILFFPELRSGLFTFSSYGGTQFV